jgi:hypothetical protein
MLDPEQFRGAFRPFFRQVVLERNFHLGDDLCQPQPPVFQL